VLGFRLDLMILEVLSNLNDSMILLYIYVHININLNIGAKRKRLKNLLLFKGC